MSSAGTFKQSASSGRPIYRGDPVSRIEESRPNQQEPLLGGSSASSNDYSEYEFKSPSFGVQQRWNQSSELRRNLSAFRVANSLSMSNLSVDRGRAGVFSSSGLLVSNDVVAGFPLLTSGNCPSEYDSSDITPYENFNTSKIFFF